MTSPAETTKTPRLDNEILNVSFEKFRNDGLCTEEELIASLNLSQRGDERKRISSQVEALKIAGKLITIPDSPDAKLRVSQEVATQFLDKIESFRKKPRARHWEFLLAMEDDLKTISKFIDISLDSFNAFSIELSAFILKCCSQIEILKARITDTVEIKSQLRIIQGQWPEFQAFCGFYPLWGIELCPWNQATSDPAWWLAYNEIKHDINKARKSGNLENALDSFAALYIMTLYYERYFYGNYQPTARGMITLPQYLYTKLISPKSNMIKLRYGQEGYKSRQFGLTIIWCSEKNKPNESAE